MRLKITSGLLFCFFTIIMFSSSLFAEGVYPSKSVGSDLSWPNCNKNVTSLGKFGIVGVTNGLGYSTNPCLSDEAANYSNLSLYVNTGWDKNSSHINPSSPKSCQSTDLNCLAYNYGYNGGIYALNAANFAGQKSSTWWLDVESANTWSSSSSQNRNSLQGEKDSLYDNGVSTVGIYSTTVQWNNISGSWQNNWPSWGATTWRTAKQAKTYCNGHEFTGGTTWLIQFVGSIDQDYAC